ncbi:hypothetical protein FQZ97_827510 [compost metagenome]
MHFDAVEAGFLGATRRVPVVVHYQGNLFGAQCTGHRGCPQGLGLQEHHLARLDRRGRYRRGAVLLQAGVGHAPDVPELADDLAARVMHGIGDAPPGRHLLLGVDARGEGIAASLAGDVGGLRDEQAGGGPLPVILHRQLRVHTVHGRAGTGQRRHGDPVGHLDRADRQR